MRSLHPTETAGDGKPILKGRYNDPRDKPDHHIACAQCGFQVDLDVNQVGDSLYSPGVQYGPQQTQTVKLPVPAGAKPISFTDTFVEPQFTSGCPFCGSYNSTGKGIGREFGSGVDIANL